MDAKEETPLPLEETPPLLEHGSYTCPGLHDPDSRVDIRPTTFHALYAQSAPRIVIPLLQRKYCWNSHLIEGYWRDICHKPSGHSVGKIIFKQTCEDSITSLICIDGQQRITTSLLLIIALRDFLATLHDDSEERKLLLQKIHRILFRSERFTAEADVEKISTLIPSYLDRAPFFELLKKDRHVAFFSQTRESRQFNAYSIFSKGIEEIAEQSSVPMEVIAKTLKKTLSLSFIRCEILTEINLPQVFLWFQEKSLWGMAALLYNPSPGINFHASDLIRNLVIAHIMDLPLSEQVLEYKKIWLDPLETKYPGGGDFDVVFRKFLDWEEHENAQKWTTGAFQEHVESIYSSNTPGTPRCLPGTGIRLYARFYSYFQSRVQTDSVQSILQCISEFLTHCKEESEIP